MAVTSSKQLITLNGWHVICAMRLGFSAIADPFCRISATSMSLPVTGLHVKPVQCHHSGNVVVRLSTS